MNRIIEFLQDDSTKLSMGRLAMILLVLAYIGSEIYLVGCKGMMIDIPVGVAGLVMALYGVNKFSPTIPFGKKEATKEG